MSLNLLYILYNGENMNLLFSSYIYLKAANLFVFLIINCMNISYINEISKVKNFVEGFHHVIMVINFND